MNIDKTYSNDFQEMSDKVMEVASKTELWNNCQRDIDAVTKSMDTDDEEIHFSSYNEQLALAMFIMYDMYKEAQFISLRI